MSGSVAVVQSPIGLNLNFPSLSHMYAGKSFHKKCNLKTRHFDEVGLLLLTMRKFSETEAMLAE